MEEMIQQIKMPSKGHLREVAVVKDERVTCPGSLKSRTFLVASSLLIYIEKSQEISVKKV